MSNSSLIQHIAELESRIELLETNLAQAKCVVQQWMARPIHQPGSAAEERAKNQGADRGFFSALLGSKFRSAMRAGAVASNAAIAKDVAEKRRRISEEKREAQELVRRIQSELAETKRALKALGSSAKHRATKEMKKSAADSIDLLHKLKEARNAGLLTEQEYEEKRTRLVSDL